MVEATNNYRFYLLSKELGRKLVEEPPGYDDDKLGFELQDQGRYYKSTFPEQFTLLEKGREYLLTILNTYGITPDVRLIVDIKEDVLPENWRQLHNVGVDLRTLVFDEEKDNPTVTFEVITGGMLQRIEARWSDEYDITVDTTDRETDTDLDFKNICLPARKIFRQSVLKTENSLDYIAFNALDNNGATAMTIPLYNEVINSDRENVRSAPSEYLTTSGDGINSTYLDDQSSNAPFYRFNDRGPKIITVNIDITFAPLVFIGTRKQFYVDLITLEDGTELRYKERRRFGSIFYRNNDDVRFDAFPGNEVFTLSGPPQFELLPSDVSPWETSAELAEDQRAEELGEIKPTFINFKAQFEIELLEGESLALGYWSEENFGTQSPLSGVPVLNSFIITAPGQAASGIVMSESTLTINEDSDFPKSTAKGIRVYDAFKKLCDIQGYKFDSSIFGPGGKHYDLFLMHGTWIRNVPQIIPLSNGEIRRVQSNLSFEDLFNACSILEPLRYDAKRFDTFYVGAEIETQKNKTGITLRDNEGVLMEPAEKSRAVISENYYGSIRLGSTTTGENYGEVNNLYSVCGNARWNTINTNSESAYEVTTDFRTGAEDIELQRQIPYSGEGSDTETQNEGAGRDSEKDNDWFFIDCKPVDDYVIRGTETIRCEYGPKFWDDYNFDQLPKNVFSPETVYNWLFLPTNLLYGHSWKIAPGIWRPTIYNDKVHFISSNCNSSVSKIFEGVELQEDQDIVYNTPQFRNRFMRPTVKLMAVSFRIAPTQDIKLALQGDKYARVEYLFKGELKYGRILDASTNGQFNLIEAF